MEFRRTSAILVGLALILAVGLLACERALVIPSGAQTVHATVTEDAVRLDPTTLHAGLVYIKVDSTGPELEFIGGADPASGELIGLTDERLEAVLGGDRFQTFTGSGFRSGGELGNASELGDLPAGKYLLLPAGAGAVARKDAGVLEVLP